MLTKLLGGKHIQRLPETYLVPLLGIKKLELLDTDEAYIVDTVENSLQSAGVVADRHKLENNLVQNYYFYLMGIITDSSTREAFHTIERAFIEGRTTITTADLIRSIKDTKSISCTLKDKIASIQKTVEKIDIKPASLDDKKEKEPDPSQVYMKATKAKV